MSVKKYAEVIWLIVVMEKMREHSSGPAIQIYAYHLQTKIFCHAKSKEISLVRYY